MQSRVILVTGGTGVLGSAIVRVLSSHDGSWRVVANYVHDTVRAEALQGATGASLHRADVGDEAAVQAMFANLPPLFAVVHAAGITRDALLLRQTHAGWTETLRVNATGAFLVTRAALGQLQPGGRLVLLGSRVGERGNAGQTAYAASKAALIALARCAAREGAARRVAVNIVCPGFVPSALSAALDEDRYAVMRSQSVLNTVGTAEQVTATVLWLLSDAAATISGQVIHCDSRI